jgi:dihydrodipicolinate synthase/N-acetylneuraminate lyase
LHPALLRAAASVPLDPAGRFDEAALTALLSRIIPAGAHS